MFCFCVTRDIYLSSAKRIHNSLLLLFNDAAMESQDHLITFLLNRQSELKQYMSLQMPLFYSAPQCSFYLESFIYSCIHGCFRSLLGFSFCKYAN